VIESRLNVDDLSPIWLFNLHLLSPSRTPED
jgi:hypothetical protein